MNEQALEHARRFVYVPCAERKMPVRDWKWVGNCPDDVDPRSEENPWVLSYDETIESEKLDKIRERYPDWDNKWIRVGTVDDLDWINVDIDLVNHDNVLADPDDFSFDEHRCSVIDTENGVHLDIVGEDLSEIAQRDVTGIDFQGNIEGMLGVAGDPFHESDGYSFEGLGDVVKDDLKLLDGTVASYKDESIFTDAETIRDVDPEDVTVPDEVPEDEYLCVRQLTAYRTTMMRYDYLDDPYDLDNHLGQMLIAVGYDTDEAFEYLKQHPPKKDTGFNAAKTKKGIESVAPKIQSGNIHPPTKKLARNGVDIEACECPVHGRFGKGSTSNHTKVISQLEMTDDVTPAGDTDLRDEIRREYQEQFSLVLEEEVNGHIVGPKAVGKTYNAARAGEDKPVTLIVPTKDKLAEIAEELDPLGVSYLRLPSFPEHSPLYDEWKPFYDRGALPREIYSWADDVPEMDEYRRRSDADWSEYDVLLGTPAHGHLSTATDERVVIYDDAELRGDYREKFEDDSHGVQIDRLLDQIDTEHESWRSLRASGEAEQIEQAIMSELPGDDEPDDVDDFDDVFEALEDRTDHVGATMQVDRRKFLETFQGVGLGILDWISVFCDGAGRDERLLVVDGEYILCRYPNMSGTDQLLTMGAYPAIDELKQAFTDMGVKYDGMFGTQRHADMNEALGRVVIQTSRYENYKAATNRRHDPERVGALADELKRTTGEEPRIFTTKAEKEQMDRDASHYGSLVGKNEFGDDHVAVVGGSTNYGYGHVKENGAYAGKNIGDPVRQDNGPAEWDSEVGSRINKRMKERMVDEAITRVGRNDAERTIVAVDTSCIPEWHTVVHAEDRTQELNEGEQAVLEYVREADGPVQVQKKGEEDLVDATGYSKPHLYNCVESLVEAGWLSADENGGDYGATTYDEGEEDLVNCGLKGLTSTELTKSDVSVGVNPQWGVKDLTTGATGTSDRQQTTIAEASRGG